jgi:hypothetical protein
MDKRTADDLMLGAGKIAEDVLGKNTKKNRRKIYHLHGLGVLGTFKIGGEIAGRRSTIRERIADHERRADHKRHTATHQTEQTPAA